MPNGRWGNFFDNKKKPETNINPQKVCQFQAPKSIRYTSNKKMGFFEIGFDIFRLDEKIWICFMKFGLLWIKLSNFSITSLIKYYWFYESLFNFDACDCVFLCAHFWTASKMELKIEAAARSELLEGDALDVNLGRVKNGWVNLNEYEIFEPECETHN